jgi:hypothetical protein
MLKAELERTTGKPLELTPEDRQRLAEKAAGIDPETLRQICVFDPAELAAPDQEPDSTENRQRPLTELTSAIELHGRRVF